MMSHCILIRTIVLALWAFPAVSDAVEQRLFDFQYEALVQLLSGGEV